VIKNKKDGLVIKNKKYDPEAFAQPLVNLNPDIIIIGFTGALGSGCTFLSNGLAQHHNYMHLSLSEPLHEEARLRGLEETIENLQKIGNEYRTKDGFGDILVWMALREANERWKDAKNLGIILDGIKNTNEVAALRSFRNFFLFSIHAEEVLQKQRLLPGRCKSEDEYKTVIKRDAEERLEFGQQINRCNDLADIVVINNKPIQKGSERLVRDYVQEKLYGRYVSLIELLASGVKRVHDYTPTIPETLMTAAYVESRRSKCLKRKVGAIIASPTGDIIAAGFNEVPGGLSCWEDPDYNWCARDILQEKAGRKFLRCPNCGTKIKIVAQCVECGQIIRSFTKRCPSCNSDPEIDYLCPKCQTKVYKEYLAGGSPDTGKMLDLCRSLHAEENAILRLGKTGVSVPPDAQIYITAFPCNLCANKIVMTGIKKVIYSEPYITKEAEKILKKGRVETDRFEGVKSTAYFRLYS